MSLTDIIKLKPLQLGGWVGYQHRCIYVNSDLAVRETAMAYSAGHSTWKDNI